MSSQDEAPDMIRTLEALLLSPVVGRAVAHTLIVNAAERQTRMVVADLRMRRAWQAHVHNARPPDRPRPDRAPSPWARPG